MNVQWDGGANLVIHGRWSRDTHLGVVYLIAWPGEHELIIEVVAEGVPEAVDVPVEILAPNEFMERYPEYVE